VKRNAGKWIVPLLLLALLLSLSACRSNKESDSVNIPAEQLAEYVIVYPVGDGNAKVLAEKLGESICERYGYSLSVADSDATPAEKEIRIGTIGETDEEQPLQEGKYLIVADDSKIYARGTNALGDYCAVYALMDMLLNASNPEDPISLPKLLEGEIPVEGTLKAMSFNLKASSITPVRMASVMQTIQNYMPDTFGVQEGSDTWMNCLEISLGEIYAHVGEGRNGGDKGERSAIFYRKDRFDLMESGTKWLSDTPDTVSKFEDSAYYRIYTYAVLQEKKTGNKFLAVNTHLDNSGSGVRGKQIAVLLEFLADYENQCPIVLTGDFNTGRTSSVYSAVTEKLADAAVIAERAEDSFTYHKYGEKQSYLDYIFVSGQRIAVSHYRVITEKANGVLPSDHYPLVIEYSLVK